MTTAALDAQGAPTPSDTAPDASPVDWPAALRAVLADPEQPRLVHQPIVDLHRGVVAGYEALARFDGPIQATPDVWFDKAAEHGCATELEARVVRRALAELPQVPRPRFLTVNVTPTLLTAPELAAAFGSVPSLTGLVVELTEHVAYDMSAELLAVLAGLRAAGALIAVDDAGSGYAGLGQLLGIRPQLVKLDRALVDHVDTDAGKAATVRMLGTLSSHLDAWLLAEGVERVEELDACLAMGVPLGQGWLFGRPGPGWAELPQDLAVHMRRAALRLVDADRIDALATTGTPLGAGERPGLSDGPRVELDARGCPVALFVPRQRDGGPADLVAGHRRDDAPLLVHAQTPVAVAAQRAMSRPADRRFAPLVCIDDTGRYVGVVPLDVVVHSLTRDT